MNEGEKHWNWKGGVSEQWYRKLMAEAKIPAICVDCGRVDKLHIHHKNKDHTDNRVENLEFLCPKCHRKRHPRVYTPEERKMRSIQNKGEKNPNFGNHWTQEMKDNLSRKFKGRTPWNKGLKKN